MTENVSKLPQTSYPSLKQILRRRKVLQFLDQGLTEREIAEKLGVCRKTVSRDKKWLETNREYFIESIHRWEKLFSLTNTVGQEL
jgi:IS30 family transposase